MPINREFSKHHKFEHKLLMIGFGGIGQCTLPLLLRHIDMPASNITVIEKDDNRERFAAWYGESGVNYEIQTIVKSNLTEVLNRYLGSGDIVVNLSANIDCIEIVGWCQNNGVLYVDSSLENWPGEHQDEHWPVIERTLYGTHQMIRDQNQDEWADNGPTAIVTHGANPGLVSHFTKAALLRVAEAMELDYQEPETKEMWADLCMKTRTKVIHVSERDTQTSRIPKRKDEFVNTWSVESFWAEATGPAEIGWGTHEKWAPEGVGPQRWGHCNTIFLNQPCAATLVRSWLPDGGPIIGFCVQHSEVVTISDYFTVWDYDDPVYRPTVAFVYLPCDAAIASLHELRQREWNLQPRQRVINRDIIAGIDELGVLLLGHDCNAWWYGSQLSIEETRELVPGQNATSLQVSAAVFAATVYAMRHPNEGFREPEQLPHREILELARPYLGPMASVRSDWSPLKDRSPLFQAWEQRDADRNDVWQFRNFLVR